jgi:hypothetical protein
VNHLIDPFAGELVEFSKAVTAGSGGLSAGVKSGTEGGAGYGRAGVRGMKHGKALLRTGQNAKVFGQGMDAEVRAHPYRTTASALIGGNISGMERQKRRQEKQQTLESASKSAGKMPTLVSTKIIPMQPVGRHGNAGPDTKLLRRRKRHVGPEPGWEKYSKQFEGGAVIAKRGTPMSDMAHTGRHGYRLVTV